jgi:sodium-independent sulfate anion transporter 11
LHLPSLFASLFSLHVAAITIAVGQIHSFVGISHNVRRVFVLTIYDLCNYITEVRPGDIVFGMICIALVVFLKYFKVHIEHLRKTQDQTSTGRVALRFLWLVCTARNAVVVMIGALVGYTLTTQAWFSGQLTLISTERFPLPQPQPPNVTLHSVKEIGIGIAVAPFISFLESIAIAKAFARKDGYKVEPSQELVAIGFANVVSSFFSSYPVTGSFSRTAVNNQSGVRTPAAGIITGSVVLLAIAVLSQFFHYIPKTSLSAIIIVAVLPMVDVRILYRIFKIRALDDLPLVVAFLFTLILGIEYGVPMAVVVYVAILLYRKARPRHELKIYPGVICVVFNGGWNYPGVEYIWRRITSEIATAPNPPYSMRKTSLVILDCSAMPEIDFTIVQALKDECSDLQKKNIQCVLVNCQPQVLKIVQRAAIKNLQFKTTMREAMELASEGEESMEVIVSTNSTGHTKSPT